MNNTILYEKQGNVATITMNRPEALNAITVDMIEAFSEALTVAAADEEVRALILTGAGTAFCVGADIRQLKRWSQEPELRERFATGAPILFRELMELCARHAGRTGAPQCEAVTPFKESLTTPLLTGRHRVWGIVMSSQAKWVNGLLEAAYRRRTAGVASSFQTRVEGALGTGLPPLQAPLTDRLCTELAARGTQFVIASHNAGGVASVPI